MYELMVELWKWELEMATHSSILAWKISWAEEARRLQFMGSQRVRHDWATKYTHIWKLNNKWALGRAKQLYLCYITWIIGFFDGSVVNEYVYNAGDMGLIPGPERSPGEGNGSPIQYYCLENPMDRREWRTTVHRINKESDAT